MSRLLRSSSILLPALMILGGCGEDPSKSGPGPFGFHSNAPEAATVIPPLSSSGMMLGRREILDLTPLPTTEPSRSLIGTETGEDPPDAGPSASSAALTAPSTKPAIEAFVSDVSYPPRSSQSLEKVLRQTVYFNLVNRCRDSEGKILPPEAILLRFTVSQKGEIVSSTISSVPKDPKYTSAANCMMRELAASNFIAPAESRDETTQVTTLVPSVD